MSLYTAKNTRMLRVHGMFERTNEVRRMMTIIHDQYKRQLHIRNNLYPLAEHHRLDYQGRAQAILSL